MNEVINSPKMWTNKTRPRSGEREAGRGHVYGSSPPSHSCLRFVLRPACRKETTSASGRNANSIDTFKGKDCLSAACTHPQLMTLTHFLSADSIQKHSRLFVSFFLFLLVAPFTVNSHFTTILSSPPSSSHFPVIFR